MSKFLMATLKDGRKVVAEFSKLKGTGQGYTGRVFAQAMPFNAWRVVGHTHPVSGERVLVRTRVMINGAEIAEIAPVQPRDGIANHNYEPENFEPATEIQRGQYGVWTAPRENTPEGAQPGVAYPVHRDEVTLARFVYLSVDPERKYSIDTRDIATGVAAPVDVPSDGPGDADDDYDEEGSDTL
jgi:hypothetical protein